MVYYAFSFSFWFWLFTFTNDFIFDPLPKSHLAKINSCRKGLEPLLFIVIARTGESIPTSNAAVLELTESPVLLLKEWPSRRFSIPLRPWLFFLLPLLLTLLQMPYLFSLLLLGLWVLE